MEGLGSFKRVDESFRLLRTCYQEAIGELPKLTSLSDALNLKENRRKDIERLRSVLGEIEESLLHGETVAARTAAKSFRKAARDLARGTTATKIGRWVTYLSLPAAIAEAYFALLPVIGVSLAIGGATSTFISDAAKAKSNWIPDN